ncbi:MAG TPA: hemerythrin domain-containing protein [Gaiellaceae bacterium]|nr:hemerythrin domain-containing protein [Gaiellaceae bacterium]
METDWGEAPLSELCDHIVTVHHARTRELLARLEDDVFAELRVEIEGHMRDEEQRLFPAIAALERHEVDAFPLEELESFEAHHIRMAAEVRRLLREAEGESLAVLADLEGDLHVHLHEEHNVLFPRALAALGRAYA